MVHELGLSRVVCEWAGYIGSIKSLLLRVAHADANDRLIIVSGAMAASCAPVGDLLVAPLNDEVSRRSGLRGSR